MLTRTPAAQTSQGSPTGRRGWGKWYLRLSVLAITLLAGIVIYLSNDFLTDRFTQAIREQAKMRLALYVNNLTNDLERNEIVPQLLARDAALIKTLIDRDPAAAGQRLQAFVDEIGAVSLTLLDRTGQLVASTDPAANVSDHSDRSYFLDARDQDRTVYVTHQTGPTSFDYIYARRLTFGGALLGVIRVSVDGLGLETGWEGVSDAVLVLDENDMIVMSTEPGWHGLSEEQALARAAQQNQSLITRLRGVFGRTATLPADAYVNGAPVLRREMAVTHEGWRMVSYTNFASVRERVNGILAIEVMGFAILLAFLFWSTSRRTASRLVFFQRESAELRALNRRLQREISEREKVEKTLEVAEQTIAQSSKLAALGEMSAAVSHELNQPLAAMKTYLAGAQLLLQRDRQEEALSSFQRIDDLIARMSAITRQLKSYARKGTEAFEPIDARAAVSTALALMEPQLKTRAINIVRTMPSEPVMIMGDRLRLEQVIVNLLRNALDATKSATNPTVEILLAAGDMVNIQIRDNGEGIENLDELFEPFYTTKEPGDGVGLGLAISSGIINNFGGRLTARNGVEGGAIFEVQLPGLKNDAAAAE